MEQKLRFSKFITEKRKEAGLTQNELAERLFVGNSAVSKWERGLSYPDISLVPAVCRELNISEHEFFTACEDLNARTEKKQAAGFRKVKAGWFWSLLASYAIAILTCFIVNLAVDHALTWFWIVLTSVALAFSVTNLPMLLKKNRTVWTFAAATALTFLLELVCCLFTGGDWFWNAAVFSLVPMAFAWLVMVVIKFLKVDFFIKCGIVSALSSAVVLVTNPLGAIMFNEETPVTIMDYLDLTHWSANDIGNKISVYAFMLIAVILLVIGVVRSLVRRGSRGGAHPGTSSREEG